MNAREFAALLEDLLDDLPEDAILDGMIKRTKSYAGLLTSDDGLIVELVTGEEFQITVTLA